MDRKLLAVVAVATGFVVGVPGAGPLSNLLGIAQSAARETYTRKRVNGRWVTGTFTAEGGGRRAAVGKTSTGKTSAGKGQARHRLATRSARAEVEAPVSPSVEPPMPPRRSLDTPSLSTASLAGPPGPDAVKENMRSALEARARALASAAPVAAEPLPILLPPRSVIFDLERGTKTVVYGDDIAVTEPFDRNGATGLANLQPSGR